MDIEIGNTIINIAIKKTKEKEIKQKEKKVCNSCGHLIDDDGFCTAPLSNAD